MYVIPGGEGSLQEGESGWLGAWWLGFIVISIVTLIFAPLLALFPERLPTEEDTEAKRLEQKKIEVPQSPRDYVMETINCGKRLLKNKVYVFNSLSTIAFLFGVVGFGTFVPKYFEYHFRRSTSSSGSSGGMSKALGSVVGILISGAVLTKFRFRSRVVAAWNVVLSAGGVGFFIIMSLIACPRLEISGLASSSSPAMAPVNLASTLASCQSSCQCSQSAFSPTCSSDGVSVFFSPCHAGCSEVKRENVTISGRRVERKVYSSCSCLQNHEANITSPWWLDSEDDKNSSLVIAAKSGSYGFDQVYLKKLSFTHLLTLSVQAIDGYCPFDCGRQFSILIGLLSAFSLLGSTGRLGNQLISLRAVEPRDKAAGLIIMVSLLSLLVFLPSPLIVASIMGGSPDL